MSGAPPAPPPPTPPGGSIRGADVALSIGATVFLYVVGLGLAGLLLPLGAPETPGRAAQVTTLAQLAVMSIAMLGAVYLVVIRRSGQPWSDLGYVRCDPNWIRRAVLLAVVLLPLLILFAAMVRDAVPPDDGPGLGALLAPRDMSWLVAGVTLAYAGFLTPIAEEIFFRGLVYGWLRRHLRFAIAGPLSSGAFAVLHPTPDAMAAAFVIGMVLSWLYERSGSILPSITLHQMINVAQIGLLYLAALARPTVVGA